jgi:hypothetical protein
MHLIEILEAGVTAPDLRIEINCRQREPIQPNLVKLLRRLMFD